MPHFSSWAAKEKTSLEADYLVDNRQLQSKNRGILFRQKPELAQKATKLAQFGTTVRGVPYNSDWLEVDGLYLPMIVDGVEVLHKLSTAADDQAEYDGPQEGSNLPAWLLGAPVAVPRKPRPVEIIEDFRKPRPPAVGIGPGEWYEVIAERAVIRSAPTVNAHIENIKNRGEFVELFEWDDKQEWRRCKDSWQAGWMLIRHASLGQILMRVESALLPSLTPMCAAVMTNDLGALRAWLSEVPKKDFQRLGPAALTMAAARGFLDCLVVLLQEGADPAAILAAGPNCAGFREPAATHALARALTAQDFNMADFDAALAKLQPSQQRLAEELFEQAAEDLKARRRDQARFAYAVGCVASDDGSEDGDRRRLADDEAQPQVREEEPPPPDEEVEGEVAEVIARRVAVRSKPQLFADILAEFRQGDQATLLEFDETSAWRKVRAKDTDQFGWTLIHHKTLGQLWRILDASELPQPAPTAAAPPAAAPTAAAPTAAERPGRTESEDWDDVFGK